MLYYSTLYYTIERADNDVQRNIESFSKINMLLSLCLLSNSNYTRAVLSLCYAMMPCKILHLFLISISVHIT